MAGGRGGGAFESDEKGNPGVGKINPTVFKGEKPFILIQIDPILINYFYEGFPSQQTRARSESLLEVNLRVLCTGVYIIRFMPMV
jgi:hypothetical protein